MERSRFLSALISLMLTLFVSVLGLGLCLVSSNHYFQQLLIEALTSNQPLLYKIGLIMIFSSFLILVLYYALHRRAYYTVQFERSLSWSLHRRIVEKIVNSSLCEISSSQAIPFQVFFYGKKLELLLDLSKVSLEKHDDFLEKLEPSLMDSLSQQTGLPQGVTLSVLCSKS